MFGGDNGNPQPPHYLNEMGFQYQANVSNPLELFGNCASHFDPVNNLGNKKPVLRSDEIGREIEDIQRHQSLDLSLSYGDGQDEADCTASTRKLSSVSTGLRLSYDIDEHNSSLSSASGTLKKAGLCLNSYGGALMWTRLREQAEEIAQILKIQEGQLAMRIQEMKQRHVMSLLTCIEKAVAKKVLEKDIELETMNLKNRKLMERIQQLALETQKWQYQANYNESVVNVLKTNFQEAVVQGFEQLGKEGIGDSGGVEDTASCVAAAFSKENAVVTCRSCKVKEGSILLMPCRHLCLCKDCDTTVNACPVCHVHKNDSFQVYFS